MGAVTYYVLFIFSHSLSQVRNLLSLSDKSCMRCHPLKNTAAENLTLVQRPISVSKNNLETVFCLGSFATH